VADTTERRLIVNADDFGLSPGVNAGIIEAHAAGSVTSTSMMVHCPGWDDALQHLPSLPRLGIGLHFNVLLGAPLSRARSLCEQATGGFLPFVQLAQRALLQRISRDDVERECEAQLDALRTAGVTPTHIDSHRHTHALPVLHDAVARVAERHRLPLRRPQESLVRNAGDLTSVLHRVVVAAAWAATAPFAPATRHTDHFMGIALQGRDDFTSRLLQRLDGLARGTTELMVHPGHVDDALRRVDGYTAPRERELTALCSDRVRDRLRRVDLRLIHFGDL
jgi:predicted glycoside hydrolase/deacetylase ChbG (UPF0249 family)